MNPSQKAPVEVAGRTCLTHFVKSASFGEIVRRVPLSVNPDDADGLIGDFVPAMSNLVPRTHVKEG